MLVDWSGNDENVAEGRLFSSDPGDSVNGIPLGPNAVSVGGNCIKTKCLPLETCSRDVHFGRGCRSINRMACQ